MALALECRVCGGPVAADAGGLRQGVASCPSCGTVHQVTKEGLVEVRAADELDDPPASVAVDRRQGTLLLTARSSSATPQAYGRELLVGLVAGVASGVLLTSVGLPWYLSAFASFFVFFLTAQRLAKGRRYPPPVRLRDDALRPSRGFGAIAASDVRQIYVSVTPPQLAAVAGRAPRAGEHDEEYWLCALLASGKRVVLLGPLRDLVAAQYLELRLEVALGLADRQVVGAAGDRP